MLKRTSLIALAILAAATTTAIGGTSSDGSSGDRQTTNPQCLRALDIAADQLVNGQGKRIVVMVDDCARVCFALLANDWLAQASRIFAGEVKGGALS